MFSTSAPFFNPGNSEEGSGSNSSNRIISQHPGVELPDPY